MEKDFDVVEGLDCVVEVEERGSDYLMCEDPRLAYEGEKWLLENDPQRGYVGRAIRNVGGLAWSLDMLANRSCGQVSLDRAHEDFDGAPTHETLEAKEENEIEHWRLVVLNGDLEKLLEVLAVEGIHGLAKRMGCTPRSVQMKLKKLVEQGVGADLFFGEAA